MSEAETPLWTAAELVAAARGLAMASPMESLNGVSIDSRTARPGDIFVALVGPNHDGHDFVAAALDKGAGAAIVSRVPRDAGDAAPLVVVDDTLAALEHIGDTARLRTSARIAAVTGSVGKTGTKEMLALALSEQGPTHYSLGSYNNQWGVPLSLARMPRHAAYGVFELGMNHAGEIAPLTRLVRPDVAIVTTIEPAHLEFFDSIEAIADAKAEIFLGMAGQGTAVLNRDNAFYDRLAAAADARGILHIASFGEHEEATIRLVSADLEPLGSTVVVQLGDKTFSYRLSQPGRHIVMNSLAVVLAAQALGADPIKAADSLARFEGVSGRGRRLVIDVQGGTATLIDESYNASPASMQAALAVLGQTPLEAGGRRVAVLGDMLELGEHGAELHKALAVAISEAQVGHVFACGRLMRGLSSEELGGAALTHAETAAELLPFVSETLRPGDVVMVKGSLGSRMADIVKPLAAGAAALFRGAH